MVMVRFRGSEISDLTYHFNALFLLKRQFSFFMFAIKWLYLGLRVGLRDLKM